MIATRDGHMLTGMGRFGGDVRATARGQKTKSGVRAEQHACHFHTIALTHHSTPHLPLPSLHSLALRFIAALRATDTSSTVHCRALHSSRHVARAPLPHQPPAPCTTHRHFSDGAGLAIDAQRTGCTGRCRWSRSRADDALCSDRTTGQPLRRSDVELGECRYQRISPRVSRTEADQWHEKSYEHFSTANSNRAAAVTRALAAFPLVPFH